MSEEIKPKKEKRFLKTLGKVGEILLQEVLLKLGSSLIRKIGGKKTLPSILFLFLSLTLFAQYPNTGNKQRLGFQTTGDGLTWRGSISDTASIQPISNQNAWVILDTVNLKIYSFDFTSNVWNPLPQGDTTSLSNRINLKLNISDTASMLLPYAKKSYVDTAGRFYARQDFTNVTTSTLTWTQTDTLVPAGVNVVQVYRNGQILLPSQYTIPTKTSVIIASTSFKVGENYTVIFPKGGGGSGGGSGSLTSISGGTGITVSPNPITTTGTVSADLSVLMELTDTSLLNLASRFATKLNISDTAAMLANYATKAYADTTGRLYARQDFTNVSTSTLTWTQSDTLIPGGVTFVQVYRNGQILLPSQYTIPTKTSIVIAAASFKIGENYTVIFPKGGGGSGGGSGSLTSISGGTGITVSPNPITTTGTVSADLSVLMELTDTSLLNLTSRFALKLNATDTASLSNRVNAKGTGTVTSVATGYGLSGGTITSTGTLLLDSAVVFSRIRDSIVDVAIGNDTIKILKQEYAPATTSVLTWTVTSKFPIQLKAFILVFRNGQLLINDQYNLTDTNKITIVSNSFKVGANYTVVTVSGIGSVGTGVFPNPVYPESGIAVSTGSAWASSVANNSSNWNIAFNDKINNAAFSGTNTKTLTLTQYDGGTFTPTFTDLQGVTGVTAGTGLTGGTITTTGTVAVDFTTVAPLASPTFTGTVSGITKSMIGLSNVDNTSDANKPVSTATQTALNLKFNIADTSQLNLTSRFAAKLNISDTASMLTNYLRSGVASSTYLTQSNAASTYLPFTGGTLTGALSGTTGGFITKLTAGNIGSSIGSPVFTAGLSGTATEFHIYQGTGYEGSPTTLRLTNNNGFYYQNGLFLKSIMERGLDEYNGRIGIMATDFMILTKNSRIGIFNASPSTTLDISGTLNATGATTLGSTLVVTGAVTLSTTTATPTALLGKDGSNVVGAVTTVAQTGLMTRGLESNLSTILGSELINVTHNLGNEPTSVLVTVFGNTSYILQVSSKASNTFTVQVKNYDGTPAINATLVSFSWLAIK
jgi:hypothetical protein